MLAHISFRFYDIVAHGNDPYTSVNDKMLTLMKPERNINEENMNSYLTGFFGYINLTNVKYRILCSVFYIFTMTFSALVNMNRI